MILCYPCITCTFTCTQQTQLHCICTHVYMYMYVCYIYVFCMYMYITPIKSLVRTHQLLYIFIFCHVLTNTLSVDLLWSFVLHSCLIDLESNIHVCYTVHIITYSTLSLLLVYHNSSETSHL